MNKLVTDRELSEILGLSRSTISRLRTLGLPYKKIGRSVRYDLEEVKKWIDENKN